VEFARRPREFCPECGASHTQSVNVPPLSMAILRGVRKGMGNP
jgi:hypothetical protein